MPIYQRSYAWEDSHVQDFLDDIGAAIENHEQEYFIGSVVVMSSKSGFLVVDGQQRLATTSIVISAIRDQFDLMKDEERVLEIERKYLFNKVLRTKETQPRLTLNESDNDFFLKKILLRSSDRDGNLAPSKKSHERLSRAFDLAKERVKYVVAKSKNLQEALFYWIDYLESSVKIISVKVNDDTNAFTIFETLNDRGRELAISDLLKNNMFNVAGDRINEVQKRWVSMTGALEAVDSEEMIVTYIRHLWSSKNGSTRERDLYGNIKKKISAKGTSVEFAGDLERNAKIYAALLNPSHEFWTPYGASVRHHIGIVLLLRMVQIRPLLLAVLDVFPVAEAKKCIRLFVSWGVRFLITGGLGGGTLETHYCDRAKEIRGGAVKNAKALAKAMESVVPSDSAFQSAFSVASVTKSYLARYYLAALENTMRGKANPELVPNANEEVLNLEHVLPQNPSSGWNIDAETAEGLYRRIGNLTLLAAEANADVGNGAFSDKRKIFSLSDLAMTKAIAKQKAWGSQQIAARQEELAKLAVRTWPVKM